MVWNCTGHVQCGAAGVECCSPPHVADCKGRPNECFKLNILIDCTRQLKMMSQMFGNAPGDCVFPDFVAAIVATRPRRKKKSSYATADEYIVTLCGKNATLLVCLQVALYI